MVTPSVIKSIRSYNGKYRQCDHTHLLQGQGESRSSGEWSCTKVRDPTIRDLEFHVNSYHFLSSSQ